MRKLLINKIRKISLRYGFYPYLVKAKVVVGRFSKKRFKTKLASKVVINDDSQVLWGKIHLSEKPIWKELTAQSGARLLIKARVQYSAEGKSKKKAILLLRYYDKDGKELEDKTSSLSFSSKFKARFKYLEPTAGEEKKIYECKIPSAAQRVKIGLARFNATKNEKVEIGNVVALVKNHGTLTIHDPKEKRYTSDLTVACVLDEFTAECLSHEVNLIKVTQEAWQSQLENSAPDFLLVESCWRGNDGNWGTISVGSGGIKKLSGLLKYCKQHDIPTVLWNKEDPPHYDKFGPLAQLFDLAITTDINMVPRYKEDFNIDVFSLSFAAQPRIHNPKPVIKRQNKAVFAGSYYSDKPKRCADFNEVMGHLEKAGVQYDIFDRNYLKNIEKFIFPDHYQANIIGNLPAEEVWKAHKGYKYQVNMNTVQDSATMFARRVYESLASGTPVISNDSVGMRKLFGDVIIMSRVDKSITEQLRELEKSPASYHELARRGVRAVMREHTYGHRIQTLCHLLDINVELALPEVTLAFAASSEADVERAKQLFALQTAPRKHLFIELENFETAYRFLNKSSDTVTFAMQLAHDFYIDQRQFYGSDYVMKCNVNDDLPAEALEDFLYWGEV